MSFYLGEWVDRRGKRSVTCRICVCIFLLAMCGLQLHDVTCFSLSSTGCPITTTKVTYALLSFFYLSILSPYLYSYIYLLYLSVYLYLHPYHLTLFYLHLSTYLPILTHSWISSCSKVGGQTFSGVLF